MPVINIVLPMIANEITLFEPDSDQDVDCGCDCKNQMSRGHVRRCPGTNYDSKHERVTNEPVEASRLEFQMMIFPVGNVEPNLAQPKQIEVIDDE